MRLVEKHYIELERKSGKSFNDIANSLSRSQRTISREVKRNTGGHGCRHSQATKIVLARQTAKAKSKKITLPIATIVEEYLPADWRPEQIVRKLKQGKLIELHYETIYQYILADKKDGGTQSCVY